MAHIAFGEREINVNVSVEIATESLLGLHQCEVFSLYTGPCTVDRRWDSLHRESRCWWKKDNISGNLTEQSVDHFGNGEVGALQ